MKKFLLLTLALPVMLCSCATSNVPQAYHPADHNALTIKSFDARTAQVLAPTLLAQTDSAKVLDQLKTMNHCSSVVVILENYNEAQPGPAFRDRSFGWFMGLRGLGYDHIVFLQGKGVDQTDGLTVLAEYF